MFSLPRMLTAPATLRNTVPRAAVVSACLIIHAPSTLAQDHGWYAELIGGTGWLSDSSYEQTQSNTGDLSFDTGFGAGAAVGFDFGDWRLEGEYLYQTNKTDSITGAGPISINQGGDFSAVVVSANAIGEFNLFGTEKAVTYAGFGLAWLQEVDIDFETDAGEISFSDSAIGAQVFVGVEYRLRERWTAGGELRYLTAGKIKLAGEGAADGVVRADYDRTSLLLSLGYRF